MQYLDTKGDPIEIGDTVAYTSRNTSNIYTSTVTGYTKEMVVLESGRKNPSNLLIYKKKKSL